MSSEKPKIEPAEALEFLAKLGQGGAEIVKGIYSTPWTGVPFTIIVLSSLEATFPGITEKYMTALGQFLGMIGQTLYNALLAVSQATTSVFGKPPSTLTTGTGNFCVKVDINPALRIPMNLGIIPNILPADQVCFPDMASRDKYFNDITARIQSAGLGWGVVASKVG